MRPISVELQAFGPFKGHEFVDFEKLAKDGVFLIDGETGSGKTMILDAITFALYGKSSGATRDYLEELRCNRCDAGTDTFVSFVFEEKGKVYKFERRLSPKRVKLSSSQSASVLDASGIFTPLFENCRISDINAKAEELIGLNYEQFHQVFILPQGKFERLLLSGSKEKGEILKSIFGTDLWEKIAGKYFDRAKNVKDALEKRKNAIDSSLSEEGCLSMDELSGKIKEIEDEIVKMEAEFKAADCEGRKKQLNSEKLLSSEFTHLHGFERDLESCRLREKEIEGEKERLERADRAEPLRKHIDDLASSETELKSRTVFLEETGRKKDEAMSSKESADKAFEAHEAQKENFKALGEKKTALELKRPVYRSFGELSAEEEKAGKYCTAVLKEKEKLEKEHESLVKATEKVYGELEAASAELNAARSSYMQGIAGFLAADLEEGKECPVCGSTHHPRKAVTEEGTATKDDVDAADRKEMQLRSKWNETDAERKKVADAFDKKKEEYSNADRDYQVAKANRVSAENNLEEGIGSSGELEDLIKKIAADIESYEEKGKALKKDSENANSALAAAEEKHKNAVSEKEKAEGALGKAGEALSAALEKSGFKSKEETAESLLSDKERNDLRSDIESFRGEYDKVKKLLADKRKELEGKTEPDLEKTEAELSEIERFEKEYEGERKSRLSEKDRLVRKYGNLKSENEKYEKEIGPAEDDYSFARALRGDAGIGLERYVLGIMFSQVIASANEMLKSVHGGRYSLYRTSEGSGSSRQKGLDLMVRDSFSETGAGRSVATLSGGEKFLISLALSIGLSGVARTGGVNIEGLFIDEGFGTLDSESIDDAMEILAKVQKSSGMVGIISHLDILRANIPTQLHVVKGHDTSVIKQ